MFVCSYKSCPVYIDSSVAANPHVNEICNIGSDEILQGALQSLHASIVLKSEYVKLVVVRVVYLRDSRHKNPVYLLFRHCLLKFVLPPGKL